MLDGVGLDRLTANFAQGVQHVDTAYKVDDDVAITMAYYLLKHEGLFVGSSSALNCVGAVCMARELGPKHTIVTILCDHGSRAMSKVYSEQFLQEAGIALPTDQELAHLDFCVQQKE